jgi:hypothetical protein
MTAPPNRTHSIPVFVSQEGVFPVESVLRKDAGLNLMPETAGLFVLRKAGRFNVGVEILLKDVVHRHFVVLAALLVQPEPPALVLGEIVFNAHSDGGSMRWQITHSRIGPS